MRKLPDKRSAGTPGKKPPWSKSQFAVFGCPDLPILTTQATPGKSGPLITPAVPCDHAQDSAGRCDQGRQCLGQCKDVQHGGMLSRFAWRLSMTPASPSYTSNCDEIAVNTGGSIFTLFMYVTVERHNQRRRTVISFAAGTLNCSAAFSIAARSSTVSAMALAAAQGLPGTACRRADWGHRLSCSSLS